MGMISWLLLLLALVGGGVLLLRRQTGAAPEAAGDKPDWRCVSLRPGLEACPAAWMQVGERYLPDEAPSLPLADCNRETCDCSFNAHEDRREPGERREQPDGDPDGQPPRSRGRRKDD